MAKPQKTRPRAWRKSEMSLWHEAINPLRGLTLQRATLIYDQARLGNYADLHWLYNEIEAADPTLMVCRDRREAALVELDWHVTQKRAGRLGRRWDPTLATEQQSFLEEAYGACDNFERACEHLMGGFFRGYAHTRPIYSADGRALLDFENLDGWNFVRDRSTGAWHWNPAAASAARATALAEIPPTELVSLIRSRHIDYPAFTIYIRAALGEQQWGEFIERYGIPPVMIVMPEFADKAEEARYLAAAEKLCEGASGALPYGSQVHYAAESRGTDPFTAFLKHQQELVVLLSTGGLLTTLTAAGSGTLAGEAHTDTWRTIVRRDARLVAAALESRVSHDLLTAAYPGKPHLVEFAFETEAQPTADAIFETATKARAAGYRIALPDLQERTGYTLITESETPQNPLFTPFRTTVANKATATPLQNAGIPLQNRDTAEDGSTPAPAANATQSLTEALQADLLAVAAEIHKLVHLPDAERRQAAEQLLVEMDLYQPTDPLLADAIETLIAEQFVAGLAVGDQTGAVANAGTSEGARKGWETRRRNGWTPEQLEANKQKVGDLAKEALDDTQSNRTVNLGKIEGQVIDDIKRATGIDVSGFEQTISSNEIRHTNKSHGPLHKKGGKIYGETAPDQVPFEREDYDRIPELYSSYDRITKGSPERDTGRPTIRYHKKYPDGKLVGVEVIATSNKELVYKTGWKKAP